MTVVFTILLALGLPLALAAFYLLGLTLLARRPAAPSAPAALPRLRIVVPAHDEEAGIGATLESLAALAYPRDLVRVVVVADNCTDRTALRAAECGAAVLERRDDARRGKGYALQYAFDRLLAEDPAWDAAVVIDADTVVEPGLLRAFAARFGAGEAAVQAAYMPRPAAGRPLSVITEVAFAAFHLVRGAGRERLGLSAGLRGNGMAFTRELLARVPHEAYSRTEDLEFGIRLGLAGTRVAFAGETRVLGDMPDRAEIAARQRERWIGGRTAIARRWLGPLLAGALRRRSAMLLDLALDLAVPPLSVLALAAACGLGAAAALALAGGAAAPLALFAATSLALGLHVATAARAAGRGRDFLRAARTLPAYAAGKALITLRSLAPSEETWVRTLRQGETK